MPKPATTIEATGKRWKAVQLVSVLLIVASVPTCVAGTASEGAMGIGIGLAVLGFAGYVAGRLGAWWFHS